MKKLWVVVGILVMLFGGAELIAPGFAEGKIEERVNREVSGSARVSANIESFPMITRLLTTGKVSRIVIRLEEVARRQLKFSDVTITMNGIEVDRGTLFSDNPELKDIDSGEVRAVIDLPLIGTIGRIASRFLSVDVSGGRLSISRGGRSLLDAELPTDLFPCRPDGRVEGERAVISCTFTEVPEWLIQRANAP